MSWIDQASAQATADVAARLGYEVRRHASACSCKCPACGEERRHTKSHDKRGAVGMPHKGVVWTCWQCGARGDAIDFVAYHEAGKRFRELDDSVKREVREFFDGPGFESRHAPRQSLRADRLSSEWENADALYPPTGELATFWGQCFPVRQDCDAVAYLEDRGMVSIDRLDEHDCVRVLPQGATCPPWAHVGERSWIDTGHRLIVALYDWQGAMRSVLARSLNRDARPKSAGAKGYQRRGLVMAGTNAVGMLRAGPISALHRMENYRLSVFEGEIDTMRALSAPPYDCVMEEDFQCAALRGTIGVFSGSFTRDVASRVPSRSTVVIATDDDEAGDKYAADIELLLASRTTCERVRTAKDKLP